MKLAEVTDVINAPIAEVWAVLADFANPQRLAPTINACTTSGSGPGALRVVESSRGLRIVERLLECDASTGRLRYEVLPDGDMPFAGVTAYECTVTVRSRSASSTEIAWTSIGAADGPAEPIADFLIALYRRATDRIRAESAGR